MPHVVSWLAHDPDPHFLDLTPLWDDTFEYALPVHMYIPLLVNLINVLAVRIIGVVPWEYMVGTIALSTHLVLPFLQAPGYQRIPVQFCDWVHVALS